MLTLLPILLSLSLQAQDYSGLRFRSIGPALTSGRVTSFAVHPNNRSHYYVGVASGGVWAIIDSTIRQTENRACKSNASHNRYNYSERR